MKKHPLEGKYIVFLYTECDYEDEGNAIAVYQLKNNVMKNIFAPNLFLDPHELNCDCYDNETEEYLSVNELAIKKIKKLGIKEVYSVFRSKDFFGIPASCQELSDILNEDEEIECWNEWDTICRGDYEYRLLLDHGIKVRFYDEDRNEFIENN